MKYVIPIFALCILALGFTVGLTQEVEAISIIDPSTASLTTANNTTTEDGFLDGLQNIFTETIQIIIDIILTPFRAIASIWTAWAGTMGWWAGPIVATFVIVVVLVMVRFYSEFDEWLDKNSG